LRLSKIAVAMLLAIPMRQVSNMQTVRSAFGSSWHLRLAEALRDGRRISTWKPHTKTAPWSVGDGTGIIFRILGVDYREIYYVNVEQISVYILTRNHMYIDAVFHVYMQNKMQ